MKKQSKIVIIIMGGILLAAVIAVTAMLMVSGSDGRKYQKHMELAQQYLDELQYEQAIAEYELAIEIEPNNVEAYQALAELYVQTEDYGSATAVLSRGIEQTGAEKLADYLEEVKENWEEKLAQAEAAQAQQEVSENSQEPEAVGPREETVYEEDGRYVINEYDEDGNLVKETWYNVDGTIDGYYIYEYDGNLVKETKYNADGLISSIFGYDGDGNRVKTAYYNYNVDGTIRWIEEYGVSGNLVDSGEYNDDRIQRRYWWKYGYAAEDGTLLGITISEYDVSGNIVKFTWCAYDGTFCLINEYDANGNRVKGTHYNADGTIKWIEEYDANGNLIKETWYNADGTIDVI